MSRVEAVELLPQVIDWLERGLTPIAPELKADDRFEPVPGDVYDRLTGPPATRYDMILIDVDHAPDDRLDDASGFFYTEEGLRGARRHLNPGGILGVWSYAESTPFSRALRTVFDEVRVEPVTFYVAMVQEERTDWLFFGRNGSREPGLDG